MFEKPLGMRDTLPELFETKKRVRNKMADEIESWGYQFIETPTLEYYETVGDTSSIHDQQLFKLLDQQGHMLVLRPDMTVPIARVSVSCMKKEGFPLRLAYDANVFRAQQREGGKPAEFEQVGIELIGDESTSADAEVIALMIGTLKRASLENFTITIGHVGFINALFLEVLGNEVRANILRRYLFEKNYVGYREHVNSLTLSSIDKRILLNLLNLRKNQMLIPNAKELVQSPKAKKAIDELYELVKILESYGVSQHIKIDLSLISHMSYYTGILFEGYAENLGFSLCNGGRYDQLFERFDQSLPATGFGIRLDRLIEALGETEDKKEIHCIIFSEERRKDAILLANKKRGMGFRVVLQDNKGIKDIDTLTKCFREVSYCIGKMGKGINHL